MSRTHVCRRTVLFVCAALAAGALSTLVGCGGDDPVTPPPPSNLRPWDQGFYVNPPSADVPTALENIDRFSQRAEIVMIHDELPWTELLAGTDPDTILARDKVALVAYLRGRGLKLFFMADLTNGLARAEEPPQLVAAGRSIAEPAVQQLYRDYVLAFVQTLHPDYIGLTAETNLVRVAATAGVYAAMVQAANAAAADLLAAGVTAPLMVSVQVETAWGRLGGTGAYSGVEQDFADFPFTQMLGLSSYPYFGFAQPEDLPDDYYTRLLAGRTLPAIVCEGGWSSASVGPVTSSTALQARYIRRQAQLVDGLDARAVIQTLFTDLDLDNFPQPYPASLELFANLGLMELDTGAFVAKPSLAVWDSLHALR